MSLIDEFRKLDMRLDTIWDEALDRAITIARELKCKPKVIESLQKQKNRSPNG